MIFRIYHHYEKWEETPMWGKLPACDECKSLQDAIVFISNTELYGNYMIKVLDEWKISCEQNLSFTSQNRQAWIGQAACYLATKSPEYITRQAWWKISKELQDAANLKADYAIAMWENIFLESFKKVKQLCLF